MDLNVSLFGKLSVKMSRQRLILPNACKAQELFCYLFLHFGCSHHREKLATLLWCDVSAKQAKAYLRKALWQIHSAFNSAGEPGEAIILVDPEWVVVNSDINLCLDFRAFEAAHNQTKDISHTALSRADVTLLQEAVHLYKGDLMEGLFEGWCLQEQERFRLLYLSILEKLIGYYEFHGEYEAGLHYGARILQKDEAREYAHQAMMRLYYLSGHRVEALRQYERCCTILAVELGVKPSKRTLMLFEQIRNDQLELSYPPNDNPDLASSLVLSQQLSEVADQLRLIQAKLSAMEGILKQNRQ